VDSGRCRGPAFISAQSCRRRCQRAFLASDGLERGQRGVKSALGSSPGWTVIDFLGLEKGTSLNGTAVGGFCNFWRRGQTLQSILLKNPPLF